MLMAFKGVQSDVEAAFVNNPGHMMVVKTLLFFEAMNKALLMSAPCLLAKLLVFI